MGFIVTFSYIHVFGPCYYYYLHGGGGQDLAIKIAQASLLYLAFINIFMQGGKGFCYVAQAGLQTKVFLL